MSSIKILVPGDEAALLEFLQQYPESSLFLQSNLLRSGLLDQGGYYQVTYAATVVDDCIKGVASLTGNGMILLQAPVGAAATARTVVTHTGRSIKGIVGPWQQVAQVGKALGLIEFQATVISREFLFSLDLKYLIVPEVLSAHQIECRRATFDDLDLLTTWHIAFRVEAFGEKVSSNLEEEARYDLEQTLADKRAWLLLSESKPVSMTTFNAELPNWVQIGGVYTLPEYRTRGFARAVVAASLIEAKKRGVTHAVLFTGQNNHAAQAAYRRLGFRYIGDFGLVLFPNPVSLLPQQA